MKKRLVGLLLCLAMLLSTGASAYAAVNSYTMKYLPGTSDTVTAMPADAMGNGGVPFDVSASVPQRDGYEFVDWTLDYGLKNAYNLNYQVTGDPEYGKPDNVTEPDAVLNIQEGDDVTLAAPLKVDGYTYSDAPESYKVKYLEYGTDKLLAEDKVMKDQKVGSTVNEEAIYIEGYDLKDPDSRKQSITIKNSVGYKWTFTGWCSDEACTKPITEVTNISENTTVYGKWSCEPVDLADNEIIFYYFRSYSYTVRYVDLDTGEDLLAPDTVTGIECNRWCHIDAKEIPEYIPLNCQTNCNEVE